MVARRGGSHLKTLNVEELVRAAVAQSVKGRLPREILDTTTLRGLGYGEGEVLELTTRLFKAVSGAKDLKLSQCERVLNFTLDSTVKNVIEELSEALPAGSVAIHGDDPTLIKLKPEVEAAVCAVLAETSPRFNFLQIEPDMLLGKHLELDEVTIAVVKIKLFKTLGSKESSFSDFFAGVQVGEESTVEALVNQVFHVLPGDDDTEIK